MERDVKDQNGWVRRKCQVAPIVPDEDSSPGRRKELQLGLPTKNLTMFDVYECVLKLALDAVEVPVTSGQSREPASYEQTSASAHRNFQIGPAA